MRIERPTTGTLAGWIVTIAAVLAAVEPVLPEDTPAWVRTALAVAAVVLAALLRSPVVDAARDGDDDDDDDAGSARSARSSASSPRKRSRGIFAPRVALCAVVAASSALAACGGASASGASASASCATLAVAIGEARDVDATRRTADLEALVALCGRYAGGGR